MQAAGLQCLKLQIAAASPDPQTRTFVCYGAFPENSVAQVLAICVWVFLPVVHYVCVFACVNNLL